MEANPYYLKDTDGGYYNKYPEFQIWEEGKQAGIKEVVKWINENFRRPFSVEEWQAKLKEWGGKMDNPIAQVTAAELVGEDWGLPLVCFIDKKPCIKNCAIYDKNLKQCAGLSIMKALDRIANNFNKEKWV